MTVAFGLGILTGQTTPGSGPAGAEYEAMLELATAAEEAGFDSVWVSEHHFASDGYLPSIMPVLAAIAARTSRIRLGAAAVIAPFHHPLRLAEDAAVVDLISKGRLELGLVNGWRALEFQGFGIPRGERASRLEESIAILRTALSGAVINHRGRHFQINAVRVSPSPQHPIPLLLGGFALTAAERAGRLGDGYIASSAAVHEVAGRFDAARRGWQRRGERMRLAVMLDVALNPTRGAVAGYRYKQEVYRRWRTSDSSPVPWPLGPGAPDRLLIRGDTRAVCDALSAYLRLVEVEDLTLIVRLHFPGMQLVDSVAAVTRFAREVIPTLTTAIGHEV